MKRQLLAALTVLLSLANGLAQVPGNVPTTKLEGWWSFNGNANDLSGNGNNFTNNGATLTTDRNNATNSAYDYSGSGQYMIVNSPSFSFAQTDSFTVSLWIEKTANQYGIAVMQSSGASGNFIWLFQSSNSGVLNFGSNKQGSAWTWANSNYGINQWEHYVGTYAGGVMSIYKNGVFVTSSTFSNTGSVQSALPLRIGRSHGGNYFDGKVDDLGVWSRVLTQTEITALYTGCNAAVSLHPNDYATSIGNNATFGIDVSTPGVTYQWQSNSGGPFQNISNGVTYQGTTSDTLLINGVTTAHNAVKYRCVVSDGSICSDTSTAAVLTVCDTVARQPIPQSLPVNSIAKFWVASNDTSATFQWQVTTPSGFVNIASGSLYTGAQTDTLTIPNASALFDGKKYRCVVTTGNCTDTSNAALLTIITNVGLNGVAEDQILVYPNPASHTLNLSVKNDLLKSNYKIINSSGKTVLSGRIKAVESQIDLSSFTPGAYILLIDNHSRISFSVID